MKYEMPTVSSVLLLPFCMIFRAHGNNRTVLPREIACRSPAYSCPITLTLTQHIHLGTMWLQDIDVCSWFDDHIMVKYTGLNILAHQGRLSIDSSYNTSIVPAKNERTRLQTNVDPDIVGFCIQGYFIAPPEFGSKHCTSMRPARVI